MENMYKMIIHVLENYETYSSLQNKNELNISFPEKSIINYI
jgi:hypothetical protein